MPHEGLIYINSGGTAHQLAIRLPREIRAQIVTDSLSAASVIASELELPVYFIGGKIDPITLASDASWNGYPLDELHWDVAFIGVEAIDLTEGMTASYVDITHDSLIVKRSAKVVALCDSSKFGRVSNVSVGSISDIDVLISDNALSPETVEELTAIGVAVELAGPTDEQDQEGRQ